MASIKDMFSGLSPTIFFAMVADGQRRQQAEEGIKALIWQYYEDFTDATEIDPKYLSALRTVVASVGMPDAYLNNSLDEIIRETEKEITAIYSDSKFYNGSERCGKGDVVVCTPGLDVDEEE